nr:PREDICTED: probable ATP-dependent RNA helicase DDX56 [Bemisia tabaci]
MEEDKKPPQFHEMELDDRILKAIAKLGWAAPTKVQQKAIPLLLDGRNVLIRARTGCGKTGAFAVPLVQNIINIKKASPVQSIKSLILAPTKELCHQIYQNVLQLTIKCSRDVCCIDISQQPDGAAQHPLLIEKPDIIVSTPSRVLHHLREKHIKLRNSLELLVIDEADLLFSFGYEQDLKQLLTFLPSTFQGTLACATYTDDVVKLKNLILPNAVILNLKEPDLAPVTQLSHYVRHAEEEEKAVTLLVLLKLQLIKGKTITFVNRVDRCYKLKLFLEQFGIKTCILNSELPASSRCHAISQFNENVYEIIIASDEKALEQVSKGEIVNKKGVKRDFESGVSRGIDFQCVSNVINFDFPLDIPCYIHRAGRTARGNNKGTVLSFVNVSEQKLMRAVERYLKNNLSQGADVLKPFLFDISKLEGFRYRTRDAWCAVTRLAIKQARLKEIKKEILNSDKLKGYFEENPQDLQSLRHDKPLSTVKIQPHLADVPDYNIPAALSSIAEVRTVTKKQKKPQPTKVKVEDDDSEVKTEKKKKRKKKHKPLSRAERKFKGNQKDPLMSMEFAGFNKRRKTEESV